MLRGDCVFVRGLGEEKMVYKLRKVVFSVTFWFFLFVTIVLTNTIWALTHP